LIAAWSADAAVLTRQQSLVDGFGERGTTLDSSVLGDDADRDIMDGKAGFNWLFGVSAVADDRPTADKLKAKVGRDSFSEI
jgi:hypothetical protein